MHYIIFYIKIISKYCVRFNDCGPFILNQCDNLINFVNEMTSLVILFFVSICISDVFTLGSNKEKSNKYMKCRCIR